MVKAATALPADPGSDLVTHTCCISPAQPTPVLVPVMIPLPVRPQLRKGRCQEQPPTGFPVDSGQGSQLVSEFYIVTCVLKSTKRSQRDGKYRAGAKIPILHPSLII